MNLSRSLGALALLIALAVRPVMAQVERSGGEANAELMQQYQQALGERDQLQQDNAKLKKDLEDAGRQLAAARQQLAASKADASRNETQLAAAQAANAGTSKTLAAYQSRMDELIARFRETIDQLRDTETDRAQVKAALAQSKSAFDKCAAANSALYQVTDQVLDRYEHQSLFGYLARSEPFTRIKRAEVDNLALEYRQRAEALRVKSPGPSGGG